MGQWQHGLWQLWLVDAGDREWVTGECCSQGRHSNPQHVQLATSKPCRTSPSAASHAEAFSPVPTTPTPPTCEVAVDV
jgi:hypothetical protein